jgi:hypothetical protein
MSYNYQKNAESIELGQLKNLIRLENNHMTRTIKAIGPLLLNT